VDSRLNRSLPATDQASAPTPGEMLGEVVDLLGGAVVGLLPFLLLSVPGLLLFVVAPAVAIGVLLLVPVLAGAIVAVPLLAFVRVARRIRCRAMRRRSWVATEATRAT
jgi:hypothetical protein